MPRRALSRITEIIIHHSATPDGKAITAEEIDSWHRARGWFRDLAFVRTHQPALPSIGYHRVIYPSGLVVVGRALEERGDHAAPYNTQSIGICLIGRNRFTEAQWEALRVEVVGLQSLLGRTLTLAGHRDRGGKGDCPGFDVSQWRDNALLSLDAHLFPAKAAR